MDDGATIMDIRYSRRDTLTGAGALLAIGSISDVARAQPQSAALTFTDAATLPLIGRAFPDRPSGWHRIAPGSYPDLPAAVKERLTNPAGLALSFTTNSPMIAARWCTGDAKQNANMAPIAQRGLDLYIRRGAAWLWAGVGRPGDGTACNEGNLVLNMDDSEKECLLYLPLYQELRSLEIGLVPGSSLKGTANPFRKRVALYGSSIVQGAAASRPGMAYPAQLSRRLGVDVINLGVSGSAKMEPAAAQLIADVDADAYVLDCVPNASPELIAQRAGNLIRTLRSRRPHAPIIIVMSIIRDLIHFNRVWAKNMIRQNATMLAEVNKLTDIEGLTVIPADKLLGSDGEATSDGTHPSDLGFNRMLQVIEPVVANVLKQNGIL